MFLRLTEKSHRYVPIKVRHRFGNQNFTGSHTENCLAFFSLGKSYGPVKGAVNHWVTGSSPVGGAIYIKALASKDARAFLLVPTFGQFRNAYTELKIQNYLRDSVATETSTS